MSPHTLGIYPVNCSACHPGGEPTRAPHLTNNSVRCRSCHE
jgi:mono/diheme cytochrome c family protein